MAEVETDGNVQVSLSDKSSFPQMLTRVLQSSPQFTLSTAFVTKASASSQLIQELQNDFLISIEPLKITLLCNFLKLDI